MFVVLCLILVVVLGILSCLMSIAVDVRAIREAVQSPASAGAVDTSTADASGPEAAVDPAATTSDDSDETIVIWEWRNGTWSAVDGAVSSAGNAPTFPGAFEGDRVKKLRA